MSSDKSIIKKMILSYKPRNRQSTTSNDKYADFIQDFVQEYDNCIPSKSLIKLRVLEWYFKTCPPKEIKKRLQKLCAESPSKFTSEIIAPYLLPDNKKIDRYAQKYSSIQHLPYLIGIDVLVEMIVKKYPFPELIGFPCDKWTEKRIHRYIRFRFDIPRKKGERTKGVKLPVMGTLKNSLSKCHAKEYNLKEKIHYYLTNSNEYVFYYLDMDMKTYPVSEEDKQKPKRAQYNATFFATLFYLNPKRVTSCKKILHISYNSNGYVILLSYVFTYFYNLIQPGGSFCYSSDKKPVFIISKKNLKNSQLTRLHNSFVSFPEYAFLICDTLEDIYDSLKKIKITGKKDIMTSKKFQDDIEDILDILSGEGFNNELKERIQKKEFIQGILEELEEDCELEDNELEEN